MRLSIGAILMVTVPDTIMRSECRGEAHGTMPRRSTSNREAKVAIISIAAGQPERHRPHRGLARPVEEAVREGGDDEAAREVQDPLGHVLEEGGVLVALRPLLAVLLHLLEVLELRPDRRRDLRDRRLYFHSSIPSLYAYTQPSERIPMNRPMVPTAQRPKPRSTRAQGKRNTARASKTMKMSATR